jgi:undecaprenyl diphosphate synthase
VGRCARVAAAGRPPHGREGVKQIVENCARRNVQVLTLFAFSSENWKRPKEEVSMLMSRFLQALDDEVADLHKNGIRLTFAGNLQQLSPALRERMNARVSSRRATAK